MGLTRRREPNPSSSPKTRPAQRHPIFLNGVKVLVVNTHKFLGVMVDQELHWKDHVNFAICKGTNWVTQYCRLAKPSKDTSAKFMRHFYNLIAVPKMLYSADLFLIPETGRSKGMKGFITRLAKIQRQASLHITGAMRLAPTDAIDACMDILPFPLLVEKIVF